MFKVAQIGEQDKKQLVQKMFEFQKMDLFGSGLIDANMPTKIEIRTAQKKEAIMSGFFPNLEAIKDKEPF